MLEQLNNLLSFHSVSGASKTISSHLFQLAKNKGLSVANDRYGNVAVFKDEKHDVIETLLLFSVDLPGFVNLYTENKKAYLSPTWNEIPDWKKTHSVRDQRGNVYTVENNEDNADQLCICARQFQIGETFDLFSPFTNEGESLCGFAVSSYSLLLLALEILGDLPENACIAFVGSRFSLTSFENTVVNRLEPKRAVLLGFCESDSSMPLLLLKDGKHFPKQKALSWIQEKTGCIFEAKVCSKAVTKVEKVMPVFPCDLLSVALPCKHPLSATETVSENSLDTMRLFLTKLL